MSEQRPPEQLSIDPIADFSGCHSHIISRLQELADLPPLVDAAERSRNSAANLIRFFDDTVEHHHRDEERELFPAVLTSATPDSEVDRVRHMIDKLKAEHLSLESLWGRLRPRLRKAARGDLATLDMKLVEQFASAYHAHAQFEEQSFLPLAREILGRKDEDLAALGESLHLRRARRRPG